MTDDNSNQIVVQEIDTQESIRACLKCSDHHNTLAWCNDHCDGVDVRRRYETFATLESTCAPDSVWLMDGGAFNNLTLDDLRNFNKYETCIHVGLNREGFRIEIVENDGKIVVDVYGRHNYDYQLLNGHGMGDIIAEAWETENMGVDYTQAADALHNAILNTGKHPEALRLIREAMDLCDAKVYGLRQWAIVVFKSDQAVQVQAEYDRLVKDFEDNWEDISLEVLTDRPDLRAMAMHNLVEGQDY